MRFVGLLDFAPQDFSDPDMWQLEKPYGQLTSDGYLIICPPWKKLDGASIPRWAWALVGHPFHKGNRFWSVPHDAGYNGYAIVLDASSMSVLNADGWVSLWDKIDASMSIPLSKFSRKWWDEKMMEGMLICKERAIKRAAVYSAVRMGGFVPWRRVHR